MYFFRINTLDFLGFDSGDCLTTSKRFVAALKLDDLEKIDELQRSGFI